MNEAVIRERLAELNDVLNSTQARGATKSKNEGTYLSEPRTDPSLDDDINNLRLQMRYLLFDLEATRRENRYLRQMLESRPRPNTGDGHNQEPPQI